MNDRPAPIGTLAPPPLPATPAPPPVWLLAMMSSLGPLSTDLYLPALPLIGVEFAASPAAVQWTLSGFMMGFAPAMLVYGPLADRFGRRPVMLVGSLVFLVASGLCALAPSLPVLVLARALQAFGACSGPVLSRAIVRDTIPPARMAAVMATISGIMSLAPAAGPVIGGLVLQVAGWRACFLLLSGAAVVLWLVLWRRLPETAPGLDANATRPAALAAALAELAASRSFRLNTLISTNSYAALFSFISAGTYVIQKGLGVSPTGFGFCFGAVAFSYFLGAMVARHISTRMGPRRMVLLGASLAATTACGGLAALLVFGPSIATIVLPPALSMVGFSFTQPNAMAGAVTPFPHMAGRASSTLGFVQWGFAALSGLALASVLDLGGVALASFSAVFTVLALLVASRL
jgi:DHA1 family bicyclomycin/chloramphenicol resistance-like MFS transporter